MIEMFHRIMQGGLTRDEARRERREEHAGPQRPQPFIFQFEPPTETFKFRIQSKRATFRATSSSPRCGKS